MARRDVTEIRPMSLVRVLTGNSPAVVVCLATGSTGSTETISMSQLQCLATRKDDHGQPHPHTADWLAIWRMANVWLDDLARQGHRVGPEANYPSVS